MNRDDEDEESRVNDLEKDIYLIKGMIKGLFIAGGALYGVMIYLLKELLNLHLK